MITLVPNLRVTNDFYQENNILNLYSNFTKAKLSCQLLIIDEFPDSELLLKQAGITNQHYCIIFDEIQGIDVPGSPIFLTDLNLSATYVPSYGDSQSGIVTYYRDHQPALQVKLTKNGCIDTVTQISGSSLIRDQYDIRGFRSSRSYFATAKPKKPFKKEWFNCQNDLVMTATEKQILIAKAQQDRFKKRKYANLAEIIAEFTQPHLNLNDPVIADAWNTSISLQEQLVGQRFYFSVEDLAQFSADVFNQAQQHTATYVFPNDSVRDSFLANYPVSQEQTRIIAPYFPDFSFSNSNYLAEQLIYWRIGQSSYDATTKILYQLLHLLVVHPNVTVVTDTDLIHSQFLKALIKILIKQFNQELSDLDKKQPRNEAAIKKAQQQIAAFDRITFKELADYQARKKLLRQARLYLDTGNKTYFSLQLEAVTAGIPQIVKQANGVVHEGVNGYCIKQPAKLAQQLEPFLSEFSAWNDAAIEDVKVIEQFSAEKLVENWKGLI
ncbi:accessory Sec system glycosyltransferase Asp1 [Lactobacillus sp. ESL0701]|uniref:accessory Sec system glycosyltransferase Asp1 n=1 Tax=Lactobacillus sp. ESL0701 TaxID=2983217 RepID=UPI0023F8D605|nr:accessory Sec system glycosyltransferase Asp1 [Lactobacillus sp. ESL0701]MDF7672013.1 accessory Sec system glycosyltransferase Asp1 [Lactobacillus sp. ESL0701]